MALTTLARYETTDRNGATMRVTLTRQPRGGVLIREFTFQLRTVDGHNVWAQTAIHRLPA